VLRITQQIICRLRSDDLLIEKIICEVDIQFFSTWANVREIAGLASSAISWVVLIAAALMIQHASNARAPWPSTSA